MYRLLLGPLSVFCVMFSGVAEAQIVRIGPFGGVSVRAPFVSVDTLPFGGGTRVRAPFTSINTRAFASGYVPTYRGYPYGTYRSPQRYGVPAYPAPRVYSAPAVPAYPPSSRYESARPSGSSNPADVARRLRTSALRLQRSLAQRRDDGDVWLTYLAPDRVVETIDQGRSPDSLRDLLRNYEGVMGNGQLASIQNAGGFRDTHQLLRQFVQAGSSSMRSEASSVEPTPSDTNDIQSREPTPAQPIRPADDGELEQPDQQEQPKVEEIPLPTPL